MHTRLIAGLTAALALGTATAGAHPQPHGTVYVTERSAGTASAFDAATGNVLWTTAVGASPIGIVHPRGTEKVYTSDETANQMSVLDRGTGALLGTSPRGAA